MGAVIQVALICRPTEGHLFPLLGAKLRYNEPNLSIQNIFIFIIERRTIPQKSGVVKTPVHISIDEKTGSKDPATLADQPNFSWHRPLHVKIS